MDLIDRSKLEAFGATCKSQDYMDGVKDALEYIDNLPTVDAIPIEFIKKKINKIREIEDQAKDEPLSAYFKLVRTSERCSLEWLLLDWKAEEQEKQKWI